jgi:hypothetical protein
MDTIDTPIQLLRRKYRPVPSIGVISFQYDIRPEGAIEVTVDFSKLEVAWTRVYLMNEQGARTFTRFEDAGGVVLEGDAIGIWASSAEFAGPACMSGAPKSGAGQRIRFCVEPIDLDLEPPVRLYYGRERYKQYNWRGMYSLSWAGVDLALQAPQSTYRYRITLEAR